MTGRTAEGGPAGPRLADLGLAGVPVLDPLSYPGRPVPWPALLDGDLLRPLEPSAAPVGRWRCAGPVHRTAGGPPLDGGRAGGTLDDALRAAGGAELAGRAAVVAVGSNAAPGQVRHKLRAAGVPALVPMAPVTVGGLAAGVSAHISRPGYVGAAPFAAPVVSTLAVCWLDEAQLAAVDATEPNYHRVPLAPDAFPVALADGTVLPRPWLYVGRHGLLAPGGGGPRRCGDQRALLRDLLAASGPLRALLGDGPHEWVLRAAADPAVRARGVRLFREHGWVVPAGAWPDAD